MKRQFKKGLVYDALNRPFWLMAAIFMFTCYCANAKNVFLLKIDSLSSSRGQNINVPVRPQGFQNMLSIQGTISYDTAGLTFLGVTQFGLSSLSLVNFGLTGVSNGTVTFSWTDPSLNGVSFPDDSILFSLQFVTKVNACGRSEVAFINSPAPPEFVDINFSPLPYLLINGSVMAPAPSEPLVLFSNDTLFSNSSLNHQWLLNGIALNGATQAYCVPLQSGDYSVIVTDSVGCSAVSSSVPFVLTADAVLQNDQVFVVSPNPADEWVSLFFNSSKKRNITLFDSNGRLLKKTQTENKLFELDLCDLETGIILIHTEEDSQTQIARLVKIHSNR